MTDPVRSAGREVSLQWRSHPWPEQAAANSTLNLHFQLAQVPQKSSLDEGQTTGVSAFAWLWAAGEGALFAAKE